MDNFGKNMKAGFQGKSDSMRDKAEKMLNMHADKGYDKKPAGAAYKEGGSVCKDGSHVKRQKFAAGGVAKFRHGETTESGAYAPMKRGSTKKTVYFE